MEQLTNGFRLNWELSGDKLLEDDNFEFYQESLTDVNDIRTKGNEGEKRERTSEITDSIKKKQPLFSPSGCEDVEQSVRSDFPPLLHQMG